MWKSIWQYCQVWIAKYDAWCRSMGLTSEQRRSCVPYRQDPAHDDKPSTKERE